MLLLKKKSINNSQRHQVNFKKFLLSKNNKIVKSLILGKKTSQAGRSMGRITSYHRGGSHVKKLFRFLSFTSTRNLSVVVSVMYDPRRSSLVAFCYNLLTSTFFNTLSTLNTFPGSILFSFLTFPELKLGALLPMAKIPAGSLVHSISINSNNTKYIKSSGVFGLVTQKTLTFCKIKMPSGQIKLFPINIHCVLGVLNNAYLNNVVIGKAGRSRLSGKRPIVRGVAMNPVDHPHGGQTSGGTPSKTPWGLPTKGKPTKKKKNV
jgi:large subunit ribosomal protein L2